MGQLFEFDRDAQIVILDYAKNHPEKEARDYYTDLLLLYRSVPVFKTNEVTNIIKLLIAVMTPYDPHLIDKLRRGFAVIISSKLKALEEEDQKREPG